MADLTKTIEIIFAGVNNTSTSMQSIGRDLNNLESSVGNLTGPLAGLSKSILTTEAAILAAGGAMAGVAVNEAGQFGDSVGEIGTLFNATSEQVGGLEQQILDYGRTSTHTFDEINASVYQAISTGTDYADAVQLVADAEILATGGRADLLEVTKLITSSLNAYGASTLDAADYSDVLFTAVQKGATTIPELAASLGQVTGLASAAGVPFSDLVAALSALTITSGSTAESTTLLKGVLSELISPSDELKAALGDVSLESHGLQGVMQKLLEVTNGDAEAMSELFGNVRALSGALALANDNSGAFAGALDEMANRTGVAQAANDALVLSFENINQNLLNNIKATLIEFGGPLLDGYKDVAQQLAALFQNISPSVNKDVFAPLYAAFDEASGDLTEFLKGVAEALPAALDGVKFGDLLVALDKLKGSFVDIFGGLDLTKPDDLADAIQFVVGGIEKLTLVSAKIVEQLAPFIKYIGELLDKFIQSDGSLAELIGSFLGFSHAIDAFILPAISAAGGALEGFANLILTFAGAKYLGLTVTNIGKFAAALVSPAGGLVAAVTASGIVLGGFAADIIELSGKMDENKQSLDNWNKALEEPTWEKVIVKAAALGESVSDMNAQFENTYGVTADAVVKFGSVDAALKALGKSTTEVTGTFGQTVFSITKQIEEYEKLGVKYDEIVGTTYDLVAVNKLHQKSISELVSEYGGMNEAQKLALTAAEKAVYQAALWAETNGQISGTTEEVVAAFNENKKSTAALAEEYRLFSVAQVVALSASEKAIYVAALEAESKDKTADSTKELTKAELEAQVTAKELLEIRLEEMKAVQDYQLALEELASDERLKAMEFAFELNLEALKGDTEKAVAIIDGLSSSIDSTAQLISDLFGFFLDAEGFSEKWAIEKQIDLENRRREQQLELQKRLTEALIDQMEAKTKALENNEGLITIQADGLEPEIEAFMWKIIEKIHIKAVGDQSQFLLGI